MRPVHEFLSNVKAATAPTNLGSPARHAPTASQPKAAVTSSTYNTDDTVRNVCFVWPNGRRAFFNYSYLVTGTFDPNGPQNKIELGFSSQTVTLSGYELAPLFTSFLSHRPQLITAIEPRYLLTTQPAQATVIDIQVEGRE